MQLEKYMIPCLSKTLFGIECLGCRFQRALLLLLKGEWSAAFAMYPAVYSMLAMFFGILLFFVNWLINKLLKPDEMVGDRERAMVVVLKGIIFILLFFWFWQKIPYGACHLGIFLIYKYFWNIFLYFGYINSTSFLRR